MAQYNFRAKKVDDNALTEGVVDAETENLASAILEERGFVVLFLEERKRTSILMLALGGGVKTKDVVIFARQLSVLISAQVPLVQALREISKQDINKKLKKTLAELSTEIEGGIRFSEALAHYPKIFNNFFVNIVKSGESSGRLEEVLIYLADQLEKDYEIRGKIKSALIYPTFIVGGMVVLGVFMMIFVVPKLTDMLGQTGVALPWSTQLLISFSQVFQVYWWALLLGVGFLVACFVAFKKTPSGAKSLDILKLRLPIFGNLIKYILIIRLVHSLRTLLLGGIDIIEGLKISATILDNIVYKELMAETVLNVEDGGQIAETFEKSKYIPKIVSQMMRTGEESGDLAMILEKISKFYTREVDDLIRNLMALMEPIIMVVLGGAVGVMIAAIILPMYQVSSGM
jgi:type IV pilus assembly protein PilC